jgi:hypothetical protein
VLSFRKSVGRSKNVSKGCPVIVSALREGNDKID